MASSKGEAEHIPFEEGNPVASESEALRLLGEKYAGGERDVNAFLADSPEGPFINQAKISGWPERIEWQKKYRVTEEIAHALKEKGLVQTSTPTSWGISSAGIAELMKS